MQQGAFVLKLKTRNWRMCVVKQVPDEPSSSWMLFGQSHADLSTFQLEFKPHQETMLIQHIADMSSTEANMSLQLRMVVVTEPPAVSCIGTLWPLKGLEMYRHDLDTEQSLVNAMHQSIYMLNLSPQVSKQTHQQKQTQQQSQTQSQHSMHTRSKALNCI
jgi:hypothetical protein